MYVARSIVAPKLPWFAVVVSLFACTICEGQNRYGRPGGPRMARVEGKGELVGMQSGVLQVKDGEGNAWLMQVKARPQNISVTGTADKNLLAPGMFVRFSAQLNEDGESTEPVESLTLFTPRPRFELGIAEEAALDKGAFQFGKDPKEEKEKEAKEDTSPESTKYLVSGKILKRKENDVVVSDGKSTVKISLAESPEIKVDLLGDYRMIQSGDEVEFQGEVVQPGRAILSGLKVKGAKPYGTPAEETPSTNNRKDRKRRNVETSKKNDE